MKKVLAIFKPMWYNGVMKKIGVFDFQIGNLIFHIMPNKKYEVWGFSEDWYDCKVKKFGIGPLLLIVKVW